MTAAAAPPAASSATPSPWQGFGLGAYLLVALVAVDTLTNLLRGIAPMHFGSALWRQTSLVLVAQSIELWACAGAILLIAGFLQNHRRLVGAVRGPAAIAAGLLFLLAALFAVDARSLVHYLPAAQRSQFLVLAVKGFWQLIAGAACMGAFAWVSRSWTAAWGASPAVAPPAAAAALSAPATPTPPPPLS